MAIIIFKKFHLIILLSSFYTLVFIYQIKNPIAVAIDDYQNAFQQIVDTEKYKDKFDFKVFNELFLDEKEAAVELEDFEVLFIMRERTSITKSLLESLPKLKYIKTSGMRNKSIDLEQQKIKILLF